MPPKNIDKCGVIRLVKNTNIMLSVINRINNY